MVERLIHSLDDLVAAIRARRDQLNISHETIDSIAGLQSGYAGKLLAPNPVKGLGPMSLPAVLGALGVALVMVEDTAAIERVRERWSPRKRPQRLRPSGALKLAGSQEIVPSTTETRDAEPPHELPTEARSC